MHAPAPAKPHQAKSPPIETPALSPHPPTHPPTHSPPVDKPSLALIAFRLARLVSAFANGAP